MYTQQNGIAIPKNHSINEKFEFPDMEPDIKAKGGENKDILYASLTIGVLVFLLALYLLYRHFAMKKLEKFGYNFKK